MAPGLMVRRVRWTRADGTPAEMFFLYDTSAWHLMDSLRLLGLDPRTDRVAWDGKAYVSQDNGD